MRSRARLKLSFSFALNSYIATYIRTANREVKFRDKFPRREDHGIGAPQRSDVRFGHTLPLLQYDDGTQRRTVPRPLQGKLPPKARLHIAQTRKRRKRLILSGYNSHGWLFMGIKKRKGKGQRVRTFYKKEERIADNFPQ
ncbi:MAG: hypothetical protein GF353_12960 [Candidatus Lokiarchaeota archaeon]|nr:hypothetical protein [Candidatus Lokiarchaeota archaeon]